MGIWWWSGWWWLEPWNFMTFPSYWECHHPNWRTPSFFRGVGLNHQPEKYWIALNLFMNIHEFVSQLLGGMLMFVLSLRDGEWQRYHPKLSPVKRWTRNFAPWPSCRTWLGGLLPGNVKLPIDGCYKWVIARCQARLLEGGHSQIWNAVLLRTFSAWSLPKHAATPQSC